MDAKAELRQRMMALRKALDPRLKADWDGRIRRHLYDYLRHGLSGAPAGPVHGAGPPVPPRRTVSAGRAQALAQPADVPAEAGAIGASPVVALYHPVRGEVDLTPLWPDLWAMGWRVALPRTHPGPRTLSFAEVGPSTRLAPGPYGIPEPVPDGAEVPVAHGELAVVVTPGLAFTRCGGRLGYGGGYYDRLFAQPTVTAVRVGVAYEIQVVDDLPADPHDVRLHLLVTEAGVWDCRPGRGRDGS